MPAKAPNVHLDQKTEIACGTTAGDLFLADRFG
jgi:hypothetical protein